MLKSLFLLLAAGTLLLTGCTTGRTMYVIPYSAAGTLLLTGCTTSKELIVDQANPKKWSGKVEFAPEHAGTYGPCFVLYGNYPTPLIYNEYIPINPAKTYIFKVRFRTLDPALPASGYMGFELFDAQKRKLTYSHVVHAGLGYSEVISAKKGDKFMIVKMIPDFHKIKNAIYLINTNLQCM